MNVINHNIIRIGIAPVDSVLHAQFGQQIQLKSGCTWEELPDANLHAKVRMRELIKKGNKPTEVSITTKVMDSNPSANSILPDEKIVCFLEYPNSEYMFYGTKENPLVKKLTYSSNYKGVTLIYKTLLLPKTIYLPQIFVL